MTIGMISLLTTIILGVFIPRIVISTYGSEANGLIASVTQVISYLSLLEAGVGAASLQALFQPLGSNNKARVNEILSATSVYYKKTGLYYFLGVILISIIYPLAVQSEFSRITISSVILLSGIGGAVNYYFQGKYRILLAAEGKNYIEASVVAVSTLLNSVLRIILMLNDCNLVLVQAVFFAFTIIQIIVYQIYMRRNYKWLDVKAAPDFQAISQKNSVLVHQFSYLIFANTDIILLTLFTNLKVVSVYAMYSLIFNMVGNLTFIFRDSFKFALGQKYSNDYVKFLKMFNLFESCYISIVFSSILLTLLLILPFMELYTSGISDVNYIDPLLPLLFASVKLLFNSRQSSDVLIDIVGHFQKTQTRSILETAINFVCSVILVVPLGVYGVLLGTVIALSYRFIDLTWYTNRKVLDRSPWMTYKKWLIQFVLLILVYLTFKSFQLPVDSFIDFIMAAVMLSIVIIPLFLAVGLWLGKQDLDMLRDLLQRQKRKGEAL
ncbi:sugar isomerase [Paenibacillus stellifer]|uniref:sugar isomerase n=1 Tax=Paenibacillus stellifer TaxID=169760 RepID=UPI000AAB28D4|nr:sugar isomerase [Paenibacillus stellifer]